MVSNSNIIPSDAPPEASSGDRSVTLYEVVEVMEKGSFVPLIAIPAALCLTPLGHSVLFTLIAGALMIVVGVQLLMGHSFLQLPNRFAYMPLRSQIAQHFIATLLETKDWVHETSRQHLGWVTTGVPAQLSCCALILAGLALPLLTALGQSTFLILIAALIYCVSLLTRDGRYVVASAVVLSFASIGPLFQVAS